MTGFWRIGTVGETEMERALHYASRMNDVSPIVEVLLSAADLDFVDRVLLAQYLRGDYRNLPGRRPKSETLGVKSLPHLAKSAIQSAADDVRCSMDHRAKRGRTAYRWRQRAIRLYAKRYGVSEASLLAAYTRGKPKAGSAEL